MNLKKKLARKNTLHKNETQNKLGTPQKTLNKKTYWKLQKNKQENTLQNVRYAPGKKIKETPQKHQQTPSKSEAPKMYKSKLSTKSTWPKFEYMYRYPDVTSHI